MFVKMWNQIPAAFPFFSSILYVVQVYSKYFHPMSINTRCGHANRLIPVIHVTLHTAVGLVLTHYHPLLVQPS